mgnify:CR=1 FL=1
MGINILLVDDHQTVRDGLKFILSQDSEIGKIDEAEDGYEAVIIAGKSNPDVVILDYEMPNFNGIYAAKKLIKDKPEIGILMFSYYNDRERVYEAIQAGVKGFVTKECHSNEIIDAVKSIGSGGTWFKAEIAELITPFLIASTNGDRVNRSTGILTNREKEVVRLVAEGSKSSEIAEKLSISVRTVDVHRANVLKKLNLKNLPELIRYAFHNKLVEI